MKLRNIFMNMIFIFLSLVFIVYVVENFCGCNTRRMDKKVKKAVKVIDEFASNVQDHLMSR